MSMEIVPMAILITDGVGKGSLGMVTVFYHSDQEKVEPSIILSTLVQWDTHELTMVVTKIFTNSPYFPWGPFELPFLDMATLIVGTSTKWFPLSQLCLCWLLLYSPTQVILPKEKEGDRLTVIPFTKEVLWESSIEDHHLSSLVPLSVPSPSPYINKDESIQTVKALDFGMALIQLKVVTQDQTQLKWELLHKQERLAEEQENQWARMWKQLDTTFREVLSQVSPTNLVRLLPWCLSTAANPCAVPVCSVGEVLTTSM